MGISIAEISSKNHLPANGFAALDKAYERYRCSPEDIERYGKYGIDNPVIIETPASVLAQDEILTNPSQIETYRTARGELVEFAYFRKEPRTLHLGWTTAAPYLILKDNQGKPYLSEFAEAMTLSGEDPRVMRGIKMKGLLGKTHTGWCVSTVVATPMPGDPAEVEGIKQVFYWGETLATMEPVAEVKGLKNTCIYPLALDDNDTRLDVFGRPHPHISYLQVPNLIAITKELIDSEGVIITDDLLPDKVHCGVNLVKGKGLRHRELDIHEAYREANPQGDSLHYRLGRYGYELPSAEFPKGRLTPLGILATRQQFPPAEPKPSENGVGSYYDVLYGSMGTSGRMITGISDRHVGLANIVRV
jgi:hypothetical protein